MLRLPIAFVLVLASACGPNKVFGSLCKEADAPSACGQVCDPSPGAPANNCPGGFYCATNGTCDLQCTPTGGECGDGYKCTPEGRCVDDSGPGSNGPDANCPAVNFMAMPTTPSIGLVLDQSGSMYPIPGGSNGFAEMREALVGTTGVITQLEAKAYFGSLLYTCEDGVFGPGPYTEAVVPRALNNAAAVRASIDSKLAVTGGATPTHRAIASMVQKFMAQPPPAQSPPVIVLATDGLPNTCSNTGGGGENASVNAARAAFMAGYPVYVLAMNTNNPHFQDLADAGQGLPAGQAKVYLSNNAQELKAAFDAIISGVISCDLSLSSMIDAAQAMSGKVTVNGVELTYGTDWILVNGNIIRLLGTACTNLKSTPNPMVNALFPCGAVIF